MMANRQSKTPKITNAASPVERRRSIPRFTELLLWVHAGGRCEFNGCNEYLLENPLTLTRGNYGQRAHIVAFRQDGPRGRQGARPTNIDALDNLMLLCPTCHIEIDRNPATYPRSTLEKYKQAHEARIRFVTDIAPDRKTTIVQLRSKIGGKDVAIPAPDVFQAVAPRYPVDAQGLVINLAQLDDRDPSFMELAQHSIRDCLNNFYAPRVQGEAPHHVSVFALAPIPLLMYLGSMLSDKIPAAFYQFHRDTKSWAWKDGPATVDYAITVTRSGTNPVHVALTLSLSGSIVPSALPAAIDATYTVYDMTLAGATPSPLFLNTHEDLMRFRRAYHVMLSTIVKDHPGVTEVHVFPAVPAPVAVLCGHDPLHKVHPALLVYDHDRAQGGFSYQLKVNAI